MTDKDYTNDIGHDADVEPLPQYRQQPQPYWKFGSIVRSTLPLLIALAVVGTLSGIVLQEFEDELLRFPSVLILVPALIGVGGNLGAILSSRLSTAVHLGILELKISNVVFKNNVLAVAIASVSIFLTLGLSAFAFGALFGVDTISLHVMLALALASGGILMAVLVPVSLVVVYYGHRHRLDPDDIAIPVVTTIGDIVGVLSLLAVIVILL
jgi:mgtE-like transporter